MDKKNLMCAILLINSYVTLFSGLVSRKQEPRVSIYDFIVRNSTDVIRIGLRQGININIKRYGDGGESALIHAARNNFTEKALFLITHPEIDLDLQDLNGYTALMWAAINGNKKLVEALVDSGADLNLTYADGETALMMAIKNNKTDTAIYLIKNGADTLKQDRYERTALSLAQETKNTKIINILLEKNYRFINFFRQYTRGKTWYRIKCDFQKIFRRLHGPTPTPIEKPKNMYSPFQND